jgi:hypothetical protein
MVARLGVMVEPRLAACRVPPPPDDYEAVRGRSDGLYDDAGAGRQDEPVAGPQVLYGHVARRRRVGHRGEVGAGHGLQDTVTPSR